MKKVVYLTCYEYNPFGDGGFKRTSEIIFLLKKEFQIDVIRDSYGLKLISPFKRAMCLLKKDPIAGIESLNIRANIQLAIDYYKNIIQDYDLVVWDFGVSAELFDYTIPLAAKLVEKKIVAICHNLNSLVPGRSSHLTKLNSPHWNDEEIHYLSLCDLIITISHEDNWLLNLHGINSHYFPYNPNSIPELKIYLDAIRDKRQNHPTKNFYLILGTAHNPPTYNGMKEILEYLKGGDSEIVVAGFGTEKLHEFNIGKTEILGTVSNEKLQDLLIEAKAVIINSQYSSGSLTKIPELISCGIPVIANYPATRSQFHLDGIVTYRTVEDIKKAILKIDDILVNHTKDHGYKHFLSPQEVISLINNLFA